MDWWARARESKSITLLFIFWVWGENVHTGIQTDDRKNLCFLENGAWPVATLCLSYTLPTCELNLSPPNSRPCKDRTSLVKALVGEKKTWVPRKVCILKQRKELLSLPLFLLSTVRVRKVFQPLGKYRQGGRDALLGRGRAPSAPRQREAWEAGKCPPVSIVVHFYETLLTDELLSSDWGLG